MLGSYSQKRSAVPDTLIFRDPGREDMLNMPGISEDRLNEYHIYIYSYMYMYVSVFDLKDGCVVSGLMMYPLDVTGPLVLGVDSSCN